MQVGVNVTCMYANFCGCGLSCFGDIDFVLFLFTINYDAILYFLRVVSCMLITDYMSLTTFSFHLISNEDKWNHSHSLSLSFIPLSLTREGDDYFLK